MSGKKSYKIILNILFIASFVFSTLVINVGRVNAQQAAIIQKTYNREYIVQSDYLEVTETKETQITNASWVVPAPTKEYFTIFNPDENDPNSDDKRNKTIESISIVDKFNNKLNYEIENSENKNLIISVTINQEINASNSSKITLKYHGYGLMIKSGKVRDIYIPGFPEDYQFKSEQSEESITTQVIISEKFPDLNFISPESPVERSGELRAINISQQDLLGKTTWIQLGTKQQYKFEIKQKVPATSILPFGTNIVTMPIPRDILSGAIKQEVFFERVSPKPAFIGLDIDGNLIARFEFAPNEESEIEIIGYGLLEQNQEFDLTKSGDIKDIPTQADYFLQPANFWEVDNEKIKQEAKDLKGDETNVYKIVKNTFDYVVNKIDYSFVKKYGINERQGALKTLEGGAAVCMEYSDLFITLLRAQGIPARAAFGHGFSALEFSSVEENTINHQWAEVYFPAQNGWVSFDTTWGEFGSDLVGGDLNHFFSHVASVDPETPPTLSINYVGTETQLDSTNYSVNVVEQSEEEIRQLVNQNQLLNSFGQSEKFQINLLRRPEQLLIVFIIAAIIFVINYRRYVNLRK